MRCKINQFEKVERESAGLLPYYIVRAKGTQGDEKADVMVGNVINFAAVQSRTFNFTKCLFPGTQIQCEALEAAFPTDDEHNVLEERYIDLMLYQWDTGKKFYIYSHGELLTETKSVEVEKIATKTEKINGKIVQKGDKYTDIEEQEVPRVFTKISLTLLCDENGKCVENGGEAPDEIAKRNFETGLANGVYELITD